MAEVKNEDNDEEPPCNEECGMAGYAINRFSASYYVIDTPLFLETPIGPSMDATFTYFDDAKHDLGASFSSIGSKWFCNWFSYVDEESSTKRVYYLPDGRRETHYERNAVFFPHSMSLSLSLNSGGELSRQQPDGSKLVYGHASNATADRYFLSAVVDAFGNEVTVHYDTGPAGTGDRVTEVRDSFGRKLVFQYGGGGYVVTGVKEVVGGNDKRSISLDVTGGQLLSITDMEGIVSSFEYEAGQLVTMTTPYGSTSFEDRSFDVEIDVNTTLTFNCIEVTDPLGMKETALYGPEFSSALFSSLNTASPFFQLVRSGSDVGWDAANPSKTFYNGPYGMTLFWDKKANKYHPPNLETGANFDKAAASYWYVDDGGEAHPHLMATKTPLTARRFAVYPGNSSGRQNLNPLTDHQEGWATMVRNESQNLVLHRTKTDYNELGNVSRFTDSRGRVVEYYYDTNGIALKEVRVGPYAPGSPSLYALARVAEFDSSMPTLPTKIRDVGNNETEVEYNDSGQVVKVTNALNEVYDFTYGWPSGFVDPGGDNDGFLLSVKLTDSANSISNLTLVTITYHADTGYVHEVTDSLTNEVTVYESFDALGRLTEVTHPDDSTEKFIYERDEDGEVRKYLGLVRHVNREGMSTHYFYNGNRQLVSVVDPELRNTRIHWCSCGHIESLTDALGQHTEWKRDLLGRVTRKILPDGAEISYTYEEESGRLSTVTNPNEQGGPNASIEYRYFIDGAIAEKRYPGESNQFFAKLTYESIMGRLSSAKWYDEDGVQRTTLFGYHPLSFTLVGSSTNPGAGMLHTVDGPWANDTVVRAYDALGRQIGTSITNDGSPWGSPTFTSSISSIDGLGRIKQHANNLGTFTTAYSGFDPRPDHVTSGSFKVEFDYLPATQGGYLSQIHNTHGANTISKFEYTYTSDGKIDTWQKEQGGSTRHMSLIYDLVGQLRKASTRTGGATGSVIQTLGFGYDRAGNRTSRTEDNEPSISHFNERNQLTSGDFLGKLPFIGEMDEYAEVSVTANGETRPARVREYGSEWLFETEVELEAGGTTQVDVEATDASSNLTSKSYQIESDSGQWASLVYDDNGNTTTRTVNGTTTIYTWDRENRLETVEVDGVVESFVYNAFGERVKIIRDPGGSEVERRFIWTGGNQPSQERDSGNLVQGNFFSEGEQRKSGGSLVDYRYTRDHLGSVRELVAASSGELESAYDYSPYGERIRVAGDPEPVSGTKTHRSEKLSGVHQHYFQGATNSLPVVSGDTIECWVYLDPLHPPREIMLQWHTGTWSRRAYWGENLIAWGTDGTQSRKYMGPLPEAGGWVLLEVPEASVNLAGNTLYGMAFTLFDGRAWWDAAGKRSSGGAGVIWVDDAIPVGASPHVSYGDTWTWVDAGVESEFGFTGHFHHKQTGHALAYFRAYDPVLGRWLSPDPLESLTGEMAEILPEGSNLYAYVGNDPVNWIDRTGLDRWLVGTGHLGIVIEDPSSPTGYTRFDMSIMGLSDTVSDRPEGLPDCESSAHEDEIAIKTIRDMDLKWSDYAPLSRNCRYYANLFMILGLDTDFCAVDRAAIATPIVSCDVVPTARSPRKQHQRRSRENPYLIDGRPIPGAQ